METIEDDYNENSCQKEANEPNFIKLARNQLADITGIEENYTTSCFLLPSDNISLASQSPTEQDLLLTGNIDDNEALINMGVRPFDDVQLTVDRLSRATGTWNDLESDGELVVYRNPSIVSSGLAEHEPVFTAYIENGGLTANEARSFEDIQLTVDRLNNVIGFNDNLEPNLSLLTAGEISLASQSLTEQDLLLTGNIDDNGALINMGVRPFDDVQLTVDRLSRVTGTWNDLESDGELVAYGNPSIVSSGLAEHEPVFTAYIENGGLNCKTQKGIMSVDPLWGKKELVVDPPNFTDIKLSNNNYYDLYEDQVSDNYLLEVQKLLEETLEITSDEINIQSIAKSYVDEQMGESKVTLIVLNLFSIDGDVQHNNINLIENS